MKRSLIQHLLYRLLGRSPAKFAGGGATTAEARRRRLRRLLSPHRGTNDSRAPAILPERVTLFVATVALLSLLLCIHLWPNRVKYKVGDVADRPVIAQRTVTYEDTEATEQLRQDVGSHVQKQYDPIQDATIQSLANLRTLFDTLDRVGHTAEEMDAAANAPRVVPAVHPAPAPHASGPRSSASASVASTPTAPRPGMDELARSASLDIQRDAGIFLPLPAVSALIRAGAPLRAEARTVAMKLVERTMDHVIPDDSDELTTYKRALRSDPALAELPDALRDPVGVVAGDVLMPNQRYDPRGTERKRQEAEDALPAQMVLLRAGTAVVRPNERVTQKDIDAFAKLGLQSEHLDASKIVVIVFLVLLIVSIACVYLRQFHPELYDDSSKLLLLATLTLLSVLGLRIGSVLLGIQVRDIQLGYLGMMAVASAGMVIALLLSPRAALLIVALLSIASGLILNNDLRYTVITMASSLVGIVSVSRLRNRGDLLRACLYLCGATALFTVLVGQLEGDLPSELLSGAIWGIVSGAVALGLFVIGVAVLEKPFGITTHLRLLELSDPAAPALQEFRMRVPGTYAHSLMVANLAHAAAEAIGADGLLVRVAAYYHDLGKMNRPEFFIENQSNIENAHDRLNPSLSAIVIGSHVKEGLEMLTALGIPPRVRELIQQHHGTSLMKFFYHRATEGLGGRGVADSSLEAQFRYPGPKPQSKEAAILMLADTIEAASRVLDRPTPARISDFVTEKIENIRADGQLDECDLTQRDLKTIHDVYARMLSGSLHARIEYPEDRRANAAAAASGAGANFEVAAAGHATPSLTLTTYASDSDYGSLVASGGIAGRAGASATGETGAVAVETPPLEDHGDNVTDPGRRRRHSRLGTRRSGGSKPSRTERPH